MKWLALPEPPTGTGGDSGIGAGLGTVVGESVSVGVDVGIGVSNSTLNVLVAVVLEVKCCFAVVEMADAAPVEEEKVVLRAPAVDDSMLLMLWVEVALESELDVIDVTVVGVWVDETVMVVPIVRAPVVAIVVVLRVEDRLVVETDDVCVLVVDVVVVLCDDAPAVDANVVCGAFEVRAVVYTSAVYTSLGATREAAEATSIIWLQKPQVVSHVAWRGLPQVWQNRVWHSWTRSPQLSKVSGFMWQSPAQSVGWMDASKPRTMTFLSMA